jgi:branched-chain amino acid transport system substrate-binding protein
MLWASLCAPAFALAQSALPPVKIAMIEGLSGGNANGGEAVFRNLMWAVERVNQRGGVKTAQGARLLQLDRYDSKGQIEEALSALRSAIDDGARFIVQGNSSAVAAALIEAVNKHNEREPQRRVLFLNYSAVDPILTNEKCSFWHFRFDAHADMRMAALMSVLKEDKSLKSVYLIGQDYSFGQAVLREARRQLALQRPDIRIVGDELHPVLRIKDFAPYATKIKASGAQAVLNAGFGQGPAIVTRNYRQVGLTLPLYQSHGVASHEYINLSGPAANGVRLPAAALLVSGLLPASDSQKPVVVSYRKSYEDKFKSDVSTFGGHAYDGLMLAVQAIKSANSTDKAKVRDALEATKTYVGTGGVVNMSATDHMGLDLTAFRMLEVKDGNWTLVK